MALLPLMLIATCEIVVGEPDALSQIAARSHRRMLTVWSQMFEHLRSFCHARNYHVERRVGILIARFSIVTCQSRCSFPKIISARSDDGRGRDGVASRPRTDPYLRFSGMRLPVPTANQIRAY